VIITRLSLFFVRVLHLDASKIHLFVCSVILPLLGIGLAEWLVLTGGSGWWDKEQPAGVDHVIYIPSLFSPVVEWRLGGEFASKTCSFDPSLGAARLLQRRGSRLLLPPEISSSGIVFSVVLRFSLQNL